MKKTYIILAIAIVVMSACKQTPPSVTVDIKAEESAVNDLIEKYHSAMKIQDAETFTSLITEDMISCGTDPSEITNTQKIIDYWAQTPDDESPEINIFGERLIKVSADGSSAIAMDQYFMPMYSTKIPFRDVYHLVKTSDNWKILFSSTTFIPKNEDVPKLIIALE